MLIKAKTLKGYKLHSLDGDIGKAKEFYFDDQHWTVRYLVADTGNWLTGRQVLLSPYALNAVNKQEQYISIALTRKQIEDSPSLDNDKPVSQQFEDVYYGYYGWPMYWEGLNMWGLYPYIAREQKKSGKNQPGKEAWNPHLRSTHHVSGYHIHAADGEIGHIEDFIIDDETWAIRYLIIDTQNWLPGKKILLSTQWIERVSWEESKVFIALPLETIRQAPEYTEESLLSRDYENVLHRYYKQQGYWVDKASAKEHSRSKN